MTVQNSVKDGEGSSRLDEFIFFLIMKSHLYHFIPLEGHFTAKKYPSRGTFGCTTPIPSEASVIITTFYHSHGMYLRALHIRYENNEIIY